MAYIPLCKFDTADVGFDVGAFDSGLLTDNETLSVVDSLIKSGVRILNESLNITDTLVKKHLLKIRKIIIRFRGGSYESDIEIED